LLYVAGNLKTDVKYAFERFRGDPSLAGFEFSGDTSLKDLIVKRTDLDWYCCLKKALSGSLKMPSIAYLRNIKMKRWEAWARSASR
jgi:hypothetical protein